MMMPAHMLTTLRRSNVGVIEDKTSQNVMFNDDEAERSEARRRTIAGNTTNDSTASTLSIKEMSNTLQKCLEIFNGNKLCRENAWSLSLIDTLEKLVDRHHRSLDNFGIAGSSLEASSKVYSLRVDSIYIDVMRMSAGLNAQKFSEKDILDNDNSITIGGDAASEPNAETSFVDNAKEKQKKPKRSRRPMSTITKNKDTINGRLDTVPSLDPVFGKLNSVVGSINSSCRLMNNLLLTKNSELLLDTSFQLFDLSVLEECNFSEDEPLNNEDIPNNNLIACDTLWQVLKKRVVLRPMEIGYIISETPDCNDERDSPPNNARNYGTPDLTMRFEMNDECEPLSELEQLTPFLDIDVADFEEMTVEDRSAVNNCRGLRKPALVIEDLRPTDASSNLEYSYRPLDNITQFWAGPSHWKFKRTRTRPSENEIIITQRKKTAQSKILSKKCSKLQFGQMHDKNFIKLDNKFKNRNANFRKKWEQKKLKLPKDLQLEINMFNTFEYAPGLDVEEEPNAAIDKQANDLDGNQDEVFTSADSHFDEHFADNVDCDFASTTIDQLNENASRAENGKNQIDSEDNANNTILEIACEFEGAPQQVKKIVVPFAKRAKVIDMKNLKKSCLKLIDKQLKTTTCITEPLDHTNTSDRQEKYECGIAKFSEIYKEIPNVMPPTLKESLSISIAFYSILHLANEMGFRLFQKEDLNDFDIRKVKTATNNV